jgi:hypothetical protein
MRTANTTLKICIMSLVIMQICSFEHQAKSEHSQPPPTLSQTEICQAARPITVKVWRNELWGSGTIIDHQDDVYTIVTNGHVLEDQGDRNTYQIETVDGRSHVAKLVDRYDLNEQIDTDIAILEFSSSQQYQLIDLAEVESGQKTITAGFPIRTNSAEQFVCMEAAPINLKLQAEMKGGYSIGHAATIKNGMSGGPLLDSSGRLVGINGKGIPAIFLNPDIYQYRNGQQVIRSLDLPEDQALDLLSSLSWAIPITKVKSISPRNLDLQIAQSLSQPIEAQIATNSQDSDSEAIAKTNDPQSSLLENRLSETETASQLIDQPIARHDAQNNDRHLMAILNGLDSEAAILSYPIARTRKSVSSPQLTKQIINDFMVSVTPLSKSGVPQGNHTGIIIDVDQSRYYVLVNLLNLDNQLVHSAYQITTTDGITHTGRLTKAYDPQRHIAVLEFTSEQDYLRASIGAIASLRTDKTIYLASFTTTNTSTSPTAIIATAEYIQAATNHEFIYEYSSARDTPSGFILDSDGRLIGTHSQLYATAGFGQGEAIESFLNLINKQK